MIHCRGVQVVHRLKKKTLAHYCRDSDQIPCSWACILAEHLKRQIWRRQTQHNVWLRTLFRVFAKKTEASHMLHNVVIYDSKLSN